MDATGDKKVKFEPSPEEERGGKKHTSPRKPRHKKKYHHGSYQKNNKINTVQYTSKTEEIKDDTFTIGSNMGKKWMTSREAFINYARRTYGGSVKTSLHRLKVTIVHVKEPKAYTDDEYNKLPQRLQDIWKMEYKRYSDMEVKVQDQLIKAYDILWDQCEPALKNKIKSQPNYSNTMETSNVIELLQMIDHICSSNDATKYFELQSFYALKRLINFKQKDDVDVADYYKEFEMLLRVAEQNGVNFATEERCNHVAATLYQGRKYAELDQHLRPDVKKKARDRFIAIMFMMNSHRTKYGKYKEECSNNFAQKQDQYPKTLTDALTVLEQYRYNPQIYNKQTDNHQQNVITTNAHSFFQQDDDKRTTKADTRSTNNQEETDEEQHNSDNASTNSSVTCYNCNRKGHISPDCTYTTKENGEPTVKELRRLTGSRYQKDKETVTKQVRDVAEGTTMVITDEMIEEWSDTLSATDYGYQFNINASTSSPKPPPKEIITEDLTSNTETVYNKIEGRLNPFWILLDNQSTVHVFYNTLFLRNVRQVNKELHLYTNSGKSTIDEVGELPGFGTVWVHRSGIANVLSFHGVTNKQDYHITYDSRIKDAFNVEKPDGSTREFVPSDKGLYYSDFSPMFTTPADQKETGTTLQIETVKGNIAKFSKQDVIRAKLAREFQHTAGHLSEGQMLRIARNNQLKNSPITPRDIRLMRAIFGPSIPGLKGKMTRRKQDSVNPETIAVPAHIKEHYQDLIVGMDIMHINKTPFLTTTSRHLHYHAVTALPNMQMKHVINAVTALHQFYRLRNFRITQILADGQFHPCQHPFAAIQINLNCVARDEHVPEIERLHRTIKERCRCNIHMVPFNKLPKRVTLGLVRNVIFYLNAFPHPDGLLNELSPYTLVTGKTVDYNLHCSVAFGTYAQTREPTDNTMRPRSVGAIALGPSMNYQGGVLFFSLNTGQELDRSKTDFTILPMPDDAIQERIEYMAQDASEGVLFTDRNNAPFPDDDMDYAHAPEHDSSPVLVHAEKLNTNLPVLEQAAQITGVNNDNNNNNDTNTDDDNAPETNDAANTHNDIPNEDVPDDTEDNDMANVTPDATHSQDETHDNTHTPETVEITGVEDSELNDINEHDENEDKDNEEIQPRRSIRKRNAINRPMEEQFEYQHLQNATLTDDEEIQRLNTENEHMNYIETLNYIAQMEQKDSYINDMIMMQYSLKAGLKKFGEDGRKATIKELKQMLTREVFSEIEYKNIPHSERKKALPILLFLTLKRDGVTVKGRACADGRPQKLWTPKHESASPIIAIEALFFTLIMDAKEGRDVATCDLPGHFLEKTDMEGEILLRLDGPLALLLTKIDYKRWKKHLNIERGRPTIYVRCDKAIYGTVTAALLSYKKLIGHLTDWGFEMNPYEPCCWNKDINGRQCTVVFHVDDMKLSHADPTVVTNLIKQLESVYAKTDPMTGDLFTSTLG